MTKAILRRLAVFAGMLLDHSIRHSLAHWRAYQGALAIKRGDLKAGFDELGGSGAAFRVKVFLMIEALGQAGSIADGLVAIEEAVGRSEHTDERWLMAELLRIKGELVLLQGATGAAATAEVHFRQGLDCARLHGVLSWELRAATSLARLLRYQGLRAEAMALLQTVYDRFTEGFDTADLKAARALLAELA